MIRRAPDLYALAGQLEKPADGRIDYYLSSYNSLLAAASLLMEQPDQHTLPALGTMVYGWMPTVPRYEMISTSQIVGLLENAQKATDVEDAIAFLNQIEHPIINMSWVGTSKLLHFIAPASFPIWDSKIARHFGYAYRSASPKGKRDRFLRYVDFVSSNVEAVPRCREALHRRCDIDMRKEFAPWNLCYF